MARKRSPPDTTGRDLSPAGTLASLNIGGAIRSTGGSPETSALEAVLKWCIAYVPALLLVAGFLVESAVRGLFGLESSSFEFNRSISSGLELVADIAADLSGALVDLTREFALAFGAVVLGLLAATAVLVIAARRHANSAWIRRVAYMVAQAKPAADKQLPLVAFLTTASIAVWFAWTIVLPASRISNLFDLSAVSTFSEGSLLAKQSKRAWQDFVCARGQITSDTFKGIGLECPPQTGKAAADLNRRLDLFMALTIVAMLGGIGAMQWNARDPERSTLLTSALMVVVVWNFFSLPLVYGKLRKNPAFPLADISLKSEVKWLAEASNAPTRNASSALPKAKIARAYVLSVLEHVTSVVVRIESRCASQVSSKGVSDKPGGPDVTTPVAVTNAGDRVNWRRFDVENSEIIALQYIDISQPLFENVIKSQADCPDNPTPPTLPPKIR